MVAGKDYVVEPFDTVGLGETNISGEALSALLIHDLNKVAEVYKYKASSTAARVPQTPISLPNEALESSISGIGTQISLPNEALESSISGISTLTVEGSSFSIGNMFLSMKELYGSKIITGRLQRYNSILSMEAVLEDHRKNIVTVLEARHTLDNDDPSFDEQIPPLVNDLAIRITYELMDQQAKSKFPQTLPAFRNLTLGLEALDQYNSTRDTSYLNDSKAMALSVIHSEPNYRGIESKLLQNLGYAYLNENMFNEATEIFQNLSNLSSFDGVIGLGLVYGNQGNYTKALTKFNEAIGISNNTSGLAWANKGWILEMNCSYQEAIQAFNKAIEKQETKAFVWNDRGWAFDNLKMIDKAVADYNKSIGITKETPTDPTDIQAFVALNDQGIDLEKEGNLSGSLHDFNEIIQRSPRTNPQYEYAWNNKGWVLNHQNKSEEALEACDVAIDLAPKDATARVTRGYALYYLGKYDEANRSFDKAIELNPKFTQAIYAKNMLLKKSRHGS